MAHNQQKKTMILTLNSKNLCGGALVALIFFGLSVCGAVAQSDQLQTLSVSPTLFQMTANPSQSWASEVRVINVNDYPITVYPQVVNFAPSGETGTGSLIPIFSEETKGQTLAEWVTLTATEVTIAPQQTATIPFTVRVIPEAAPGGHYAAILVGTKPPQNGTGSSLVQTAQFVTSLLFVRVSGDVTEKGSIREFTTAHTFHNEPNVQFDVRFENTGNVHLQPQGDIVITNMWGAQRGVIPINYQTHFGNVLPNSIRKFSFTWTSEKSWYDIGRFTAIATLGYGEETKNFSTSTTNFWVIPFKQIALFIFILAILLWFFSFAIKLYIKRMMMLAGIEPRSQSSNFSKAKTVYSAKEVMPAKTVIIRQYQTVTAPVRVSVAELVTNFRTTHKFSDRARLIVKSVITYRIFIVAAGLIVVIGISFVWFFSSYSTQSRSYDVGIVNPDATIVISSDELLYRSLPLYELPAGKEVIEKIPQVLEIVNASGEPGVGAHLRRKLEAYGYEVTALSNELNRSDVKTVIIYSEKNKENALGLSQKLNSALLSADDSIGDDTIKIYVGTDNR